MVCVVGVWSVDGGETWLVFVLKFLLKAWELCGRLASQV